MDGIVYEYEDMDNFGVVGTRGGKTLFRHSPQKKVAKKVTIPIKKKLPKKVVAAKKPIIRHGGPAGGPPKPAKTMPFRMTPKKTVTKKPPVVYDDAIIERFTETKKGSSGPSKIQIKRPAKPVFKALLPDKKPIAVKPKPVVNVRPKTSLGKTSGKSPVAEPTADPVKKELENAKMAMKEQVADAPKTTTEERKTLLAGIGEGNKLLYGGLAILAVIILLSIFKKK